MLGLERSTKLVESIDDHLKDMAFFYNLIESSLDLDLIEYEMSFASNRALLRLIAVQDSSELLCHSKIESTVATECIVAGLSRLLFANHDTNYSLFLEGNYLAGLAGASILIRRELELVVQNLFLGLIRSAETAPASVEPAGSRHSVTDSFTLSILAIFVRNLRGDIAIGSRIFPALQKFVSFHRFAMLDVIPETKEHEKSLTVAKLHSLSQRDVSRSILRCSIAVAHLILYQASNDTNTPENVIVECLNWFCLELGVSFPLLEHASGEASAGFVHQMAGEEWENWMGQEYLKTSLHQKESGIRYLEENGTMLNTLYLVQTHDGISQLQNLRREPRV